MYYSEKAVLFRTIFIGFILLLCASDSKSILNKNNSLYRIKYSKITSSDSSEREKIIFRDDQIHYETTEGAQTTRMHEDPCAKVVLPKPRMTGGRISEQKCAQYMSEMLNRDTLSDREERCLMKQGKVSNHKSRFTIMSNHATKPGQFPHMAALGWRRKRGNKLLFLCGGSLISPNFVLTAAHCTSIATKDLVTADPEIVRLGTRDIKQIKYETPVDVNIKRIIRHPYWDSPKKYYDIALLELETQVQFTKLIQPACLPLQFFKADNATVTGWGATDARLASQASTLQLGRLDIIDTKLCDQLGFIYRDRNWWGLKEHQMCAGKIQGGVDTCHGDSGGPLQVELKRRNTKELCT